LQFRLVAEQNGGVGVIAAGVSSAADLHGFDAEGGVNEPVIGDATVKRAMLESTRESYLMADSGKYGNVHLMALSRLSDYTCVITDGDFPQDKRRELEAACNDVIYA